MLIVVAAVLWGTTGTALAFAPEGAQPPAVGAVRILLGGSALVMVAALGGELRVGRGWPLYPTLVAALAIAAYQPFFFTGVARTGVAVGTIVAIGSAPVWAGIIGFLFRGERPDVRWGIASALAVLGCGLLVGSGAEISVDALGVLLALGAGASYGAYATASKRLLEEFPYTTVMAVVFFSGAVLLSPVLFFSNLGWLVTPGGILVALELGLVATAAAYLFFARGLVSVPVASAATLSLAEPLTAGMLGVVILDERLGPVALAGAGLLLGGLVLVSTGRKPRSRTG